MNVLLGAIWLYNDLDNIIGRQFETDRFAPFLGRYLENRRLTASRMISGEVLK